MVETQSNPEVAVPKPPAFYKGVIGTEFDTTDGIIAFLRRKAKPELEVLLGEKLEQKSRRQCVN